MHCIRFTNTGDVPWTTGPAAIFKGDVLLAQQLMTYTSVRNKVDVPLTIATDLNTKKEESGTDAVGFYARSDQRLPGATTLTQ